MAKKNTDSHDIEKAMHFLIKAPTLIYHLKAFKNSDKEKHTLARRKYL